MSYSNDNKSIKKTSDNTKVVDINIHKFSPSSIEIEKVPFTQISNNVIQGCRNPVAGFIWIYLQSRPKDWVPCRWEIMGRFNISEPTYKRHMRYLKACGLIECHQSRNADGTVGTSRLMVLNGSRFNPDGDDYRGIIFDASDDTCSRGSVDNFFRGSNANRRIKNDPPADPASIEGSNRGIKNDPTVPNRWIKKPPTGEMTPHTNKEFLNTNKDKKPPISPKGVSEEKKLIFSLKEILENNPFEIPEQLLKDWLIVRKMKKAPITQSAWEHTLTVLTKLQEAGLCPIECFKKMVSSGWQGMEFRYFEKDVEAKIKGAVKIMTPSEKALNEAKTREREIKAQLDKRREIEESHQFSKITQKIDLENLRAKQDLERINLGMTATEYHKHLLSLNKTR